MSLDHKPKGNPAWTKGKSGNPHGRPAGAKNLKSILKVAATLAEKRRHPVDELIRLADKAEFPADGSKPDKELASNIWRDLLKYCEPQKKAIEVAPEKPTTPGESLENAQKLLEEMEQIGNSGTNTSTTSSDTVSLDHGPTDLLTEADSESNLSSDQGE